MGNALTEYKKSMKEKTLSDGKTVEGAGRLTEDMIKRIQNYYGIRQNKGYFEGMKRAITAILHHVVDIPEESFEEQYRFCPKHKDSWCRSWADEFAGDCIGDGTDSQNKKYDGSKRLPHVFLTELNPIFERLRKDELLMRCLKGLTQNQH